jgi:hypothetical protein
MSLPLARLFTSLFCLSLFAASASFAQDWKPLFNGKNLDGWEVRGNSVWTVMDSGVLLGQRKHPENENPFGESWPVNQKQYHDWRFRQSWLYTNAEFEEFDLHVEYRIPPNGNSGVSIRDLSRAHHAIGEDDALRPDLAVYPKTTPAHIGYEIQILDGIDKYSTGSIYGLVPAKTGAQRSGEWNSLDIESRKEIIRVRLNGELVAEGPGEVGRPTHGPIGLQLHDQFTFVFFRNIRIRELSARH